MVLNRCCSQSYCDPAPTYSIFTRALHDMQGLHVLQRRPRPPRSAGEQKCARWPAWRCIWPELAGWRPAGSPPSSAAAVRCWLARQTDTRHGSA